jgi:general stress protein CsbA
MHFFKLAWVIYTGLVVIFIATRWTITGNVTLLLAVVTLCASASASTSTTSGLVAITGDVTSLATAKIWKNKILQTRIIHRHIIPKLKNIF